MRQGLETQSYWKITLYFCFGDPFLGVVLGWSYDCLMVALGWSYVDLGWSQGGHMVVFGWSYGGPRVVLWLS